LEAAEKYSLKDRRVKLLKDSGDGKSAALNLAVTKAKGDILILTDGDVFVERKCINKMLDFFKDERVGAVSGNPISLSPKNTKLGYWAYLLTNIADERRRYADENNRKFFCSGYLFAIRRKLFPKLPENLLSEDGYISHIVYSKGYKIRYSPLSRVYIKYPTNLSDWIKQKKRSAGGYTQLKKNFSLNIRSFKSESSGAFGFFKHIKSFKHFIWLNELFFVRIYLWYLIYRDINLKNKSREEIWERVESTK
jgi:cellulose synthase/poly-beta-1,6-N-acetylglucosamine synthase-like glycosyltransferase